MALRLSAGEQPVLRLLYLPPRPHHFQQARRQHGVTVLLSFALFDTKQAARGIDIGYFQPHDFGNAQARAVGCHQGGAVAQRSHVLEESIDFRRAQYDWKLIGHRDPRQSFLRPRGVERYLIEESHGGDELIHRRRGMMSLVQQMQLIFADVFEIEMLRAGLIKLRQSFNVVDVVALRLRREVAQLHVFRHAAAR